jgi:aspartate aminotransferase
MRMSGVSVTYGIIALMAQQTETTAGAPRGAGVTGNRISARIAAVSPSATLAVDAKAKALQAQGESVIGFGAGEPDFPTPEAVVAAAEAACRDPKNHRYTPTAGLPELREAIVTKTQRDSGLEVTAGQVLVTNGGKQAVANTFAVLCDPGDEVLMPAPYWTTYPESIALAGGVPVVVATDAASGFRVTVEQLEAARTPRTKILLFVSPSNPTGAVYSKGEIEVLGRWAAEHGIWVVTDEIYEHLVYGRAEFHSMPVLVPELADRCVVVNGVAKTYAMTGWRVGWMLGPTDVIAAATNLQSHETSNVANVSQRAALAAVSGDLSAVAMMRAAFNRRRLTMHRMLNEIDGVECLLPEGAFYAFPSVTGLYGRHLRGRIPTSSAELAELAIEEAKVAVVPGEAFGSPGYFRLSYALGDDDLVEGVSRLAGLFAGG